MANPNFSFLPWLRQGIASQIDQNESFGSVGGDLQARATVPVRLAIDAVPVGATDYVHTGNDNDIVQHIQIFGPGEVIGIDRRAIVKTEPELGDTDYEPNYLPYIEFYEEDFPWRYTPAKAVDGKLRPWLTLLVLEQSEFKRKSIPGALLPAITHGDKNIPFPDESQTWAWAHVHINNTMQQDASPTNNADKLYQIIQQDPNLASSRLVCSRSLKPNTGYQAFLIPAFEQGRLAGLGAPNARILEEDVRKSSWRVHKPDEFANTWPYYFEWNFRTGDKVDFEYLVRLIQPRVLDDNMGRRPMDCLDAGYLIKYEEGTGSNKGILELEGALQSPVAEQGYVKLVGESAALKQQFLKNLKQFLNLSSDLKETTPQNNFYIDHVNDLFSGDVDQTDDPIVLPPLYGQWHASLEKIDYTPASPTEPQKKSWFNHVNLDPRNRTAAGIGTQIVQKDQESYMDRAWGQVGDVLAAIRKLRLGELSVESSLKLFNKHFLGLSPVSFMSLTSAAHSKMMFDTVQTVSHLVSRTIDSQVFVTRSFAKLARPNGPVFKRTDTVLAETTISDTMVNNFSEIATAPVADEFAGNIFSFNNFNDAVIVSAGGGVIFGGGGIINGSPWNGIDLDNIGNFLNFGGRPAGLRASASLRESGSNDIIAALQNYLKAENWSPKFSNNEVPVEISYEQVKSSLSERMNPQKVITNKVWKGIKIFGNPQPFAQRGGQAKGIGLAAKGIQVSTPDEIVGVLAYPKFTEPMYIALKKFAETYFLPGIERIPENTFSVLVTNQRFIESYLLGLNHEMSRELLWREYPTDQKGSYFRKFWDDIDGMPNANTVDIKEIHQWRENVTNHLTPLGHNHPLGEAAANRLVFVVRGELLKRFPSTVIYMQRAKFINNDHTQGRTLEDNNPEILYPIFKATADPDITFLGFNITALAANGDKVTDPGYFIVVKERPGEPRFGFDLPVPGEPTLPPNDSSFTWNDGNWEHVGLDSNSYIKLDLGQYSNHIAPITEDEDDRLQYGKNAAHMAGILYQLPFMIAIHADAMISDEILASIP